ncbi:protein-lysine N-methyltransferase EEF2KMT isoform X1 [Arvicanthis niloticus]|uniref:protein-lysine N-methyltransferase EEF2KMT isoform X1 n=1 Tax=Arvicanthis niloticus TaxID=61156 RepID=UPI0014866622|nr:protein-lysine N-methyltransferase EEF2KMT isoform X1 [Arvicanthis niloticus]
MAPEDHEGATSLLQSFERRFLAARALPSFPWQSLEEKLREPSGSALLLAILQKTVKHPVCVQHGPSVKYARCFLSKLIQKHEAVPTEPLDALYEALAEVLMAKESTQCHRSYLLPSGDSVTLSESTAIVSHGTTGLVTWDAALYLAEWAIENPAAFTDRTVLELGSGAGLTGLAICKACYPRAYIFSDCHAQVLEQLRGNVLLNGFSLEPHTPIDTGSTKVTVAQLDWDEVTASQLSDFQADVVIAADVLYYWEVTLSLLRVLKMLADCQRKSAPDVYVAYTVRSQDTGKLFTTELDRAGIYWEEMPPHTGKLFAYEEHSAIVILKLMLTGRHGV